MHPRKFVRDSIAVALGQYISRLVLLLRGLASAAALGPHGYGSWNALSLVFDYGSYASSGALQGLDVELPSAFEHGDSARARRLMAGAWTVVMGGGVLFALGVLIYLATGQRAIETWGSGAALLMLTAALLQVVFQYQTSALRAQGRFHAVSAAQAAQVVVGGALGLALVWSLGVWGLLWGWLAGTAIALLALRRAAHDVPLVPGSLREGWRLAGIGFPIFGFFAASLVLRSMDRIALVRYGTPEALGQYSLGLMAAGLILYLPESAATVLYPRIAAAARGARDPDRTRREVTQTHRALTVALPPVVAVGVVWAAPAIGWLLPAFRDGVPAIQLLAFGALMLSASTVPAYYLLASGQPRLLLGIGAGCVLVTGVLVFGVAARDPHPARVALAAAIGYGLFALSMVMVAAGRLLVAATDRLRFAAASLVPVLWAAILVVVVSRIGPSVPAGAATWRSAAILIGYLPVLWLFGRGIGLKQLAREWLTARVAPPR